MKSKTLFSVLLLSFIVSEENALAQLQWPLNTFTIKGAFGDYRSGGFHGGIDLHATGNASFKPVRSGTTYYLKGGLLSCRQLNGDCYVFTKYQSIEYNYSHVNDKLLLPGESFSTTFDGTPIDPLLVNGYLGTITDFGQGNAYANHLHLGIVDQSGNKRDPLYNGNSNNLRLNLTQYNDTKKPTLVELVVARYFGPNDITVLDANHLPYNTPVDFIVYIHDRPSPAVSWDEKVGVNWIEWGVTTVSSPPTPPSTWNQFVKFTDKLPTSTAEAEAIYAFSNAYSPNSLTINTYHSGQAQNHLDTMWYIVTNSDGTTNYVYNQSYAWTTPGQTADRYVWIRARDSNGFTVQGNVQIHIDGTNAVTESNLPSEFALGQNYPNPFNPETAIPYELPVESQFSFSVYNIVGQKLIELVNATKSAGRYQVFWNGQDASGNVAPSGVYFLKMEASAVDEHRKFVKTAKLVMAR